MSMAWIPELFGGAGRYAKRPVSPLDEAEVYLAYKRPWLALECLQEAAAESDSESEQIRVRIDEIETLHPDWRALQLAHEATIRDQPRRWLRVVAIGFVALVAAGALAILRAH